MALVAIVSTTVASCLAPTQITIEIRTNISCTDPNARLDWTEIHIGAVGAADNDTPAARAPVGGRPACVDGYIGSLVLVPSGVDDRVGVRVVAHARVNPPPANATPSCRGTLGDDCIVARRAVSFLSHAKLTVPIFLDRACLGKSCANNETCIRGGCEPSDCTKNPGLCMSSSDAGIVDATSEIGTTDGSVECQNDSECRPVVNLCDDGVRPKCICYGTPVTRIIPACMGTEVVCLMDPCVGKVASCVGGACVVP